MKLLWLGVVAIVGLGAVMSLFGLQATGQLTFAQVEREQVFYADWNPCLLVRCAPGLSATYTGNNPDTGAMQCACPDGRIVETRDRTPKRIYATGQVMRDFEEVPPSAREQQMSDYCERVSVPVSEVHYRDLCNRVGTEMCCKEYGVPGCSAMDLAAWPSICLSKCIEDVRNQCRKAGRSIQRPGLQAQELAGVGP